MQPLPLTSESFREVASRYATGVVVVTTRADNFDHAMTATSFTTVSLDPLLALVCVEGDTRFRDSLCQLDSGADPDLPPQQWAISILPSTASATASWFATKGRPLHGQFDRVPHSRGAATGCIVLDGALASMELQTVAEYELGDHVVVVGEAVSLACQEDEVDDPEPDPRRWPLAYWARRYRSFLP